MKHLNIIFGWSVYFFIIMFTNACRKFVTVDSPANQLVQQKVFDNDGTANAAVTGIYAQMMGAAGGFARGGNQSISFLAGLSADELKSYTSTSVINQFYKNAVLPANTTIKNNLWGEPYKYIYAANSILQGLSATGSVSPALKQQLTGEAKFIRAFCNFYLVNLFGETPLITSSNYSLNATQARNTVPELYAAIISDLKDAASSLGDDYAYSQGQKVRPNKWAAVALLARVYLYNRDWANAETQATFIINSNKFKLVRNLNGVFLSNSTEAIWQLLPITPTYNTLEGNIFILSSTPTLAALSSGLLNSFETGDQRLPSWVANIKSGSTTYYYPYKYKIKSGSVLQEYSMVLRLAEQFLIRAEAMAALNKIAPAIDDLNTIRNRAGLAGYGGSADKASVLTAILKERQVELFTEWGHRWLDLKRTGTIDTVMNTVAGQKGTTWNSSNQLYPLPQYELSNNNHLKQNPGY